ncbi:MAG TPA: DUF4139 domain-containing protein [Steroidobacteraceae bacterium]|nr:DUF4139 domain-containing protein [Steroidobacteraceae bacterium]
MPSPAARLSLLSAGILLALGAAAAEPETSLTVYSSAQPGGIPAEWYRPLPGMGAPMANQLPGFALVRLDRELAIPRGRGTIQFSDVAALIDPTTVQFLSLTDPAGTKVLEQNFQFDLVSQEKLLSRYIDRGVAVEQQSGDGVKLIEGTLVSSNDGLVIRGADGRIHALREWSNISFGELPGGLITRPTLEWDVQSGRGGNQKARVSYQTGGITWWADYNLVFTEGADANSGFVDVGAWVSLLNQSGARYQDAKLKLIAGDVNRVQTPTPLVRAKMQEMVAMDAAAAPGFEEKAFFEYHLYTLGRPATIPNNSTKQIELFDAATRVPAKKRLVFDGAAGMAWHGGLVQEREYGPGGNTKVDVWLTFDNEKASGMGMPLPAGRVRVSQQDKADGSLEFVGEDAIKHTPKDEDVRVMLGSAFDVVGERRQTDFTLNTKGREMEEAFEIKVRNHKSQPVEVVVREKLYRWSEWELIEQSQAPQKKDAQTIEFPLKIPADGEATVTYRVRYSW